MYSAKVEQTLGDSRRPERSYRVVACGRIVDCQNPECEDGKEYVEAPGRNSLVTCCACNGLGFQVVDGFVDEALR